MLFEQLFYLPLLHEYKNNPSMLQYMIKWHVERYGYRICISIPSPDLLLLLVPTEKSVRLAIFALTMILLFH